MVGAQPHAVRELLDVQLVRRRHQVLDRSVDRHDDLGGATGHRGTEVHGLRVPLEPLAPAHLDALVLVRLDREHLEREQTLAVLLEQARIAALLRHLVVDAVRGLALEHLADDPLLAVPVREAVDVRALPGA